MKVWTNGFPLSIWILSADWKSPSPPAVRWPRPRGELCVNARDVPSLVPMPGRRIGERRQRPARREELGDFWAESGKEFHKIVKIDCFTPKPAIPMTLSEVSMTLKTIRSSQAIHVVAAGHRCRNNFRGKTTRTTSHSGTAKAGNGFQRRPAAAEQGDPETLTAVPALADSSIKGA